MQALPADQETTMRHALAHRTPAARLRAARDQLLDLGDVDETLLAPGLRASWLRSARFGLAPVGRMPGAPHASGPQLARALEHQRELVAHARPVMEYLFDQTRDAGSMVILADAQGLLLQALGDAAFLDRAQRVALRPGASWHEQWRGTNAIGTAIADAAPVVVHAGEHYLQRNGFLTCTAAPITGPCGRVLGVLDISGDHRGYHHHTLALVRSAARMIEQRLFDTRQPGGLRLRLHAQPEGIGTVADGRVALAEDGTVVAADATARAILGLPPPPHACRIADVLQCDPDVLAAWGRHGPSPHSVRRHDGSVLWLRVEAAAGRVVAGSPPAVARTTPAADALADLEAGDATLRAAVDRPRRVVDKPIALLLHGESGVGKEVFARAVHACGARRDGPFVAVNCAALPEGLVEAELFGYAPGAFTGARRDGAPGRIREAHGGTLFLDEIGDMPLALQARLLRVLQDRRVVPIGGRPVDVDFRLVCATHRRLRAEVEAGRFRDDLYWRLNGLALTLPPLRERQDRPALVARMLRELAPERTLRLAADVAAAMARYRWPGNLRQLHAALRTACALADDAELEIGWAHLPDDLAQDLRDAASVRLPFDEQADLRLQSRRMLREVVAACEGNLSEAARRLGISRNTLYRKLREIAA
ncbi:MAG: sigma-54-dependent Fis family transcriptional regulator [Burkholderiaceae bacterium]